MLRLAGGGAEIHQGRFHVGSVAGGAPGFEPGELVRLRLGIDGQEAAVVAGGQRRGRRLGELVDADHDLLAGLDRRESPGVRLDQTLLHVGRLDGGDGAAHGVDPGQLVQGLGHQLLDLGVDHVAAVEQVAVFEQVGLERDDLLEAQAPLLVPRPRQAQRLVPGGS